jgi:hypothetical protein
MTKMYSPKIEPDQIESLYKIRCIYAAIGERIPMTTLVREALEAYIPKKIREAHKKAKQQGVVVAPALLEGGDEYEL